MNDGHEKGRRKAAERQLAEMEIVMSHAIDLLKQNRALDALEYLEKQYHYRKVQAPRAARRAIRERRAAAGLDMPPRPRIELVDAAGRPRSTP